MELTPLTGLVSSVELQEGFYILQQIQHTNNVKDFSKLLSLVRKFPDPSILIPLFDQILMLFEANTHQFGFAIVQFAHQISFLLPRLVGIAPVSLLKHITRCFEKCHPEPWILTLKLLDAALPIILNCDLIHHYILLSFHQSDQVMITAYQLCLRLLKTSSTFPSFFATWAEQSLPSLTSLKKQKHILILLGCLKAPLTLSRSVFRLCLHWLPSSILPPSLLGNLSPPPSFSSSSSVSLGLDSPSSSSSLSIPHIYIQVTALKLLSYSPELSESDIHFVLHLLNHTSSSLILWSIFHFLARFPSIPSFHQLSFLQKALFHPHPKVKMGGRTFLLSLLNHAIHLPFLNQLQSHFTDLPITKESFQLMSMYLKLRWIEDPKPLIQWFLTYLVTNPFNEKNNSVQLFIQLAQAFPKFSFILHQFLMSRFQDFFSLFRSQSTLSTSTLHFTQVKNELLLYARVFAKISPFLPSLPNLKETLFAYLLFPLQPSPLHSTSSSSSSSSSSMLYAVLSEKDYHRFHRWILVAYLHHPKSLPVHLSSLIHLDMESQYFIARYLLLFPHSPWVPIAALIFQRLSICTLFTSFFLFLEHWMYLAKAMSGEMLVMEGWQSACLRIESLHFTFQTNVLQLDLMWLEYTPTWEYFWELSELYSFFMSCAPFLTHRRALEIRKLACQCIAEKLNPSFLHVSESLFQKHSQAITKLNKLLSKEHWTWQQLEGPMYSIVKELPKDYFCTHIPWIVELFLKPNSINGPHSILSNVDLAFQAYGHVQTGNQSIPIQYGQLGVLVCHRPLLKLLRDLPKRKRLMEIVFEQDDTSEKAMSFLNTIQANYVKVHPVDVANAAFNRCIVIPSTFLLLNQMIYVILILRLKLPNGQWWATDVVSTLTVKVSEH